MKAQSIATVVFLAAIGAASGYATAQSVTQQKADSVASGDKQFMLKAAGGGIAEVELGKLALEKASSPEVKHHAQHMIDDHTKANDELKGIASTKGIALPAAPDPKHQALIDKLKGLSGNDFDKTYIREAGVNAHKEMQTLFKDESKSGQDAEVKAFAQKTLKVVEEHLNDSQKLAAAAGASASNHRTGKKASVSSSRHSSKQGA